MTSIQRVGGAALLGAACGMRTFTGPAALALRGRLEGAPVRAALIAAAAGEAIADKTPFVPPRTAAPAVAARVLSGALSGRQLAGAAGIVPGALGAVAGTIGGYRARAGLAELTRLPAPVVGIDRGRGCGCRGRACHPRRSRAGHWRFSLENRGHDPLENSS